MITIKIEEEDLVELLANRIRCWTNDVDVIDLYIRYYESIVECFDGCEVDPSYIVDNDWINNTSVITEDEFGDYGIEDENDDRILSWYHPVGKDTIYLISNH